MHTGDLSGLRPGADAAYPCRDPWAGRWWFWPLLPISVFGALLALFTVAWAIGGRPPWNGAATAFWPIFPLGFLVVILVFFLFVRWAVWGASTGGSRHGWRPIGWDGGHLPLAVIRMRYARGEIGAEEFRRMREELDEQ